MKPENILKGKRVRLTALLKEDLPTFAAWYEDAGFSRMLDAVPAMPKSVEKWGKWLEESEDSSNMYVFGIRLVDGGKLIGFAELDGILWTHRNCWIGLGIGEPENWGKGLGTETMNLLLKFAFHELNLHRVQLSVFSYNERAITLYEQLGFTKEGSFREHLERDGERYDMHLYGLLRREWEDKRDRV
ncbi:MAG: GNAT family N-acetyltransferase [Candidatus Promineifilaceae bacterium]|jgi:RimJ/RimL family protein N-acetyltransferase